MKQIFSHLFIFLVFSISSFAQEGVSSDSLYSIRDSVLISTSSGMDISVILVQKKSHPGPLPVVLFYTTYNQGAGDVLFARRLADREYVGVVAYARGIRTDISHYAPYEHEQSDIYDIIDWISKQEWCNGKVGMYGGSYTGFSQWSAAKKLHPALKTIVPQVAVMPGFDFPMQNNVQVGFELNWAHTNILGKAPIPGALMWEWYEKGFAYAKMDSALGYTNPYFKKWLAHPSYDAYWKALVPTPQEYANIHIPVLSTTGYFDGPQISAVEYFTLHTRHNPRAEHYLVIGPYDHWGGQSFPAANLRGYEIDSVANVSMRYLAFEWLDWVLKEGPKPDLLKDKVNFQVMGTNTWRHEPTVEAMSNGTLRFYLDMRRLTSQKPKKGSFERQEIDFSDRETMNNYFHPSLIVDSLEAGHGVVFISDPVEADFLINGAFSGALLAKINKYDMDISISFYEQTPEGKYFLLSRYLGRASYAKNSGQRHLLTPNKIAKIPLGVSHIISKQIKKGSRIVVVLNVNKHPFEIINYGSGKQPAKETIKDAGQPMVIQWLNESYIEVPIWKH
jgi:uncharacterized protein